MSGELATVVFVDVERSHELLVERGDAAGATAILRVLSFARARLADYEGREVKSLGDGLMALFASPRQAVRFAVAVQGAVRGLHPRLRVGINTGEVSGADPVGEAVTAAARIAEKAIGGEVLVSEVVRHLIGTLPGVVFADRGRARLKGFPDRWRLFAAAGSDTQAEHEPTHGRLEGLAIIDRLVAGMLAGSGGVLVLSGEGGIGKTHLVGVAQRQAEAAGALVAVARAEELDPDRPGRLLLSWADSLGVNVTEAIDAGGPHVDAGAGFVLAEAVAEALHARAAAKPVLVIAEDLQWADDTSLRGLAAVIRAVESVPAVVIATMRPTPRSATLAHLLNRLPSRSRRLELDALDASSVVALATSLSDAPPGPRLNERLRATGGNPLLVIELLRALDDDGWIRVTNGIADIDRSDLPSGLRDLVLRRVNTLPAETRDLLRLASLLGREFALRDLAVVAGQRLVDVAARIQPSVDGALLAGDRDTLSFRHDLLREAIYDNVLPAIRRDLHTAAGHALAAAGATPLQVARQFQLGAPHSDAIAIDWLERAATEARRLDVGVAATLYQHVLDLTGEDWPSRRRLQIAMLEPLASAGRVAQAQQLGRELLVEPLEPHELVSVRRALTTVAANSGDLASAVEHASSFGTMPAVDPETARYMRCLEASMALLLGRPRDEVRVEVLSALAGNVAGDPTAETQCAAAQALAILSGAEGAYETALEHARASRRILVGSALARSGFLIPDVWEGTTLICLDDFAGALTALATAQARAERQGELALLVQTHACRAWLHHLAGDWDDSLSELDAATTVTDDYGNHAHDVAINALLAWRAIARAEPAAANRALAAGDDAISAGRHLFGVDMFLHAKSRAADQTPAGELELLQTAWNLTRHLRGYTQYGLVGPDLARAALAAGQTATARNVADELASVAANTKAPGAHGAAALARGIAAQDVGAALEAVAAYEDSPRRLELAGACEATGSMLFAQGRDDEAVALFDTAAEIHQSCGATVSLARCDAAMREHGVRRRRSRPRTAAEGWDALSPTESTVVALIAHGQTNPEIASTLFISRRTVESHVGNILRKLNVRTRAAVAAGAAARATTTTGHPHQT